MITATQKENVKHALIVRRLKGGYLEAATRIELACLLQSDGIIGVTLHPNYPSKILFLGIRPLVV